MPSHSTEISRFWQNWLYGALLAALCPVAGAQATLPDGGGVRAGSLPMTWNTGGPKCMEMPEWQVHEYNPDFYILRQSGCVHYEKPFLYLIFGKQRAMLVDTGAGESTAADAIKKLMALKKRDMPLVVTHSHGHGDHTAGDKVFQAMPNVTFAPQLLKAQTWHMLFSKSANSSCARR